jgi:adenine-specific DNA-methyltransferase
MSDQSEKFDLTSLDIAEDKRQDLLRLFPEIRTEGGKLDFERLKLALGEALEVGKERYGMNWSWNAAVSHDAGALEQQLELHIDHIRDGRTADDLLFEILLKSGFPLTTPVETLTLAGKTVYSIAGGALFICLERQITLELIRAMAEAKPERVVCLDEGFAGNDQLKANAVQIFKSKGVTSFKTV